MLPFFFSLAAAQSTPPATLIGVIERHGTKACRKGEWETRFYGQYWQAGWVDLVVEDALVASQKGKILQLTGAVTEERPKTDPIPDDVSEEHCPIPQMRSDMVESVDRMRHRRGNEPAIPGFAVTAAKPFEGLVADARADDVKLVFTNTLGVPLEEVALEVQFEGCYGKPGSKRRSATAKKLAPGASVELVVPYLIEDATTGPPRKGGNTRHYAFAAVLVSAVGPSTWVGIDIGPRALGIETRDCPRE